MATKLRTLGFYRNDVRGLVYAPGAEFEATPDLVTYLMADAPACFEEVTEAEPVEDKALDAPPADKMIRRASKK